MTRLTEFSWSASSCLPTEPLFSYIRSDQTRSWHASASTRPAQSGRFDLLGSILIFRRTVLGRRPSAAAGSPGSGVPLLGSCGPFRPAEGQARRSRSLQRRSPGARRDQLEPGHEHGPQHAFRQRRRRDRPGDRLTRRRQARGADRGLHQGRRYRRGRGLGCEQGRNRPGRGGEAAASEPDLQPPPAPRQPAPDRPRRPPQPLRRLAPGSGPPGRTAPRRRGTSRGAGRSLRGAPGRGHPTPRRRPEP